VDYNKLRDEKPHSLEDGQYENFNSMQRAFAFHDTLTRLIFPLCSSLRERPDATKPISSAIYLVNASSFGLKQAWQLRTYAEDVSKLLATSFPEVVDTVYVIDPFLMKRQTILTQI
jgi:hypothetical protein